MDMKVTVFERKGTMHTGVRPQSKVASDCTLAPDPRPADSTLAPDPGAAGSTLVSDPGAAGTTLASAPGAANSNHVTGCAVDIRCIKH